MSRTLRSTALLAFCAGSLLSCTKESSAAAEPAPPTASAAEAGTPPAEPRSGEMTPPTGDAVERYIKLTGMDDIDNVLLRDAIQRLETTPDTPDGMVEALRTGYSDAGAFQQLRAVVEKHLTGDLLAAAVSLYEGDLGKSYARNEPKVISGAMATLQQAVTAARQGTLDQMKPDGARPTGDQLGTVRKYLALTGLGDLGTMMTTTLAQIPGGNQLSEDVQKQVGEVVEEHLVVLVASNFDAETLAWANRFYGTAVGKEYALAQPQLIQEAQQAMQMYVVMATKDALEQSMKAALPDLLNRGKE